MREFGVRIALGASTGTVLGLVLRGAARMVGIGAAIGLVAAALLAQSISAFLFGVQPLDPVTFVSVAGVLSHRHRCCACPALRADEVDPVQAFRSHSCRSEVPCSWFRVRVLSSGSKFRVLSSWFAVPYASALQPSRESEPRTAEPGTLNRNLGTNVETSKPGTWNSRRSRESSDEAFPQSWLWRVDITQEVDEELEFHIEMRYSRARRIEA